MPRKVIKRKTKRNAAKKNITKRAGGRRKNPTNKKILLDGKPTSYIKEYKVVISPKGPFIEAWSIVKLANGSWWRVEAWESENEINVGKFLNKIDYNKIKHLIRKNPNSKLKIGDKIIAKEFVNKLDYPVMITYGPRSAGKSPAIALPKDRTMSYYVPASLIGTIHDDFRGGFKWHWNKTSLVDTKSPDTIEIFSNRIVWEDAFG